MSTAGTIARLAAATATAGAAGIGYAAGIERRHWTLRRAELPVLEPGARPLRILHLSDLHLTPGQRSKIRWVAALAALEPDLVINTGDNLAHPDAVPGVLTALGRLLDRPGAFVFGSNDYYGPTPKNPARYLRRSGGRRIHGAPLPWTDLRAAFREHGWVDATHTRQLLEVDGRSVRIAGVDDPHLNRDRYPRIAGHDPDADLRLGLTHSPEPRVLDGFAADGYDLVLAGHTHGGQLRLPGYGAIVTNCGIDRSRARGTSRWGSHTRLHVSAGLGTSPYAPVRFACPPEASLLTLVARPTSTDTRRGTPAQATGGVG
ncbi:MULTISPECIES: metallophosphoesterase [Pseudonocardia]|uniref:Phosphodiesterase YaeI n=2 Tax=Pseudonocardia TaxID=1847 RepID=A0A1Y2MWB8_PSEAH|nr:MULTISPECIES: metallophosphoesterase [Pseudonocardia]OSY39463.1 phosphodiesterase YaeI [Pseudonocardia autotrophica]TDN75299.1 putative MPP superfamily phosphohydrolase [Pseudonocardia autotrophica]BBF99245.1 metallophosphoesterase [Pseudonocardia autotrophica]GEC24791.1 metallophosphoesterase [Pseudonocardia saturnea]